MDLLLAYFKRLSDRRARPAGAPRRDVLLESWATASPPTGSHHRSLVSDGLGAWTLRAAVGVLERRGALPHLASLTPTAHGCVAGSTLSMAIGCQRANVATF